MKHLDLENNHVAKKSPFSVPDGYFEGFTAHLMEQIPEEKPQVKIAARPSKGIIRHIRPILYAAAIVCGLVFGINTFHFNSGNDANQTKEATAATLTAQEADNYVNDFCNFARVSDQDVYSCVNENIQE